MMNYFQIKSTIIIAACATLVLAMLAGCKTTEENYRSAYEKAYQKRTEGLSEEEIAGFAREEAMPKTLFRGDSIPMRGRYVKCEQGGSDGNILQYNVVVASFKQKFNASSVFQRFADDGYPHTALLIDKDGRYYVAATTDSTLEAAVASLKRVEANSPASLRQPYPYLLKKP